MTAYQYTIPTKTRFQYNEHFTYPSGVEGKHQLLLVFDWVSPVSGNTRTSSVSLLEGYEDNDLLAFYNNSESSMTSEYAILVSVANKLAEELRKELEEGGGVDFTQIAKAKFEERLKLTYDLNAYVDLDLAYQTGSR